MQDIADGTHDMLTSVLPPPSILRLLRSERWFVKSEAVVVRWIRSVLLGGCSSTVTLVYDSDTRSGCDSIWELQRAAMEHNFLPKDMDLSNLLPALIDYSQDIGSAYNISSHPTGLVVSSFSATLSASERSHIDFQAGRLIRGLSQLLSPSSSFGPAISVLCPTAVEPSKVSGSMGRPGGTDSWSVAFHAMLEGILRDAEDIAVTLPYQTIRRHFRRLGHCLDKVTVPRLVIVDAAHDSNIIVERTGNCVETGTRRESLLRDLLDDSGYFDVSDTEWSSGREAAPDIRITGLHDWSNCIFGDPLMAVAFNDKPSRDLLRGFDGRPRRRTSHDSGGSDRGVKSADDGFVDFQGDIHIRLLLYQCYQAMVAMVKEFYRPHSDSTARELAARKRLHAVLTRLNEVENRLKRNHARPSGEMSPSKKPKTEDKSEQDVS